MLDAPTHRIAVYTTEGPKWAPVFEPVEQHVLWEGLAEPDKNDINFALGKLSGGFKERDENADKVSLLTADPYDRIARAMHMPEDLPPDTYPNQLGIIVKVLPELAIQRNKAPELRAALGSKAFRPSNEVWLDIPDGWFGGTNEEDAILPINGATVEFHYKGLQKISRPFGYHRLARTAGAVPTNPIAYV